MTYRPSACVRACVLATMAVPLILAGCSTPAPPTAADTSAVNAPFRQAPAASSEALDGAWWAGYGDPG